MIQTDLILVIFYSNPNRYSFNALVGALESVPELDAIPILFCTTQEKLIQQVGDLIQKKKKVIIAISFSTPQIWEFAAFIQEIRKLYSNNVRIWAGGPHPTGDPQGTLKLGVDLVIRGEGEVTLIELLKCEINGTPCVNELGISYLNSEKQMISNELRKPIDLSTYPAMPFNHFKYGPIEISRGCPFGCNFCQTSYLFGRTMRHRSLVSIASTLSLMVKRDLLDIRFITPNAFAYQSKDGRSTNLPAIETLLVTIRKTIGEKGRIFLGSFPSEIRPEFITIEGLKLLKQYVHNDNLIIGAQTGSARLLKICNRGHSLDAIVNGINCSLQTGFKVNVDFIFGIPGETKEDIDETIQFIEKIKQKNVTIHAHTFIPLPLTPFAQSISDGLNKKTWKYLLSLISSGKLFGTWEKQAEISQKISKYLQTGEL